MIDVLFNGLFVRTVGWSARTRLYLQPAGVVRPSLDRIRLAANGSHLAENAKVVKAPTLRILLAQPLARRSDFVLQLRINLVDAHHRRRPRREIRNPGFSVIRSGASCFTASSTRS